ncbi:MAG: hypothetical protein DWB45_09765 [Xanthomonadales bacterium]|nr:hypothetical protein [Xanthomonadales bacterium]MCC6596759.1 hypothetical protein [Rhodanobacteraceae bacterium]MCW5578947.1 hypothetical protein [Dokdonella sp.]MDL1869475.1 hypothetical protein [Gammaproteobacteria bacterium PRO6]
MNNLSILVKREYWEHRGGFLWTPVWVCGVILGLSLLGMISAEVFRARVGVQLGGMSLGAVRAAISAQDYAHAGYAFDVTQVMFAAIPCIALFFVLFFYLLGALYDDRRDRSVLFWKSLPVSDAATVVSKVLSAMLLAPLVALVVSTLAYLVFVVLVSAWLALHGLNVLPALAASHPLRTLWRLLLTVPLDALWALPTIGWLLFWSAWSRSKPFLWAVMVPLLAVFANWWLGVLGAPHFGGLLDLAHMAGRLLLSVMPGSWLSADAGGLRQWLPNPQALDDGGLLHPARMLDTATSPGLWLGVVVGVALIGAAIWARRRRIETSV